MKEIHEKFGDQPYVAVATGGEQIGFFCYSLNPETHEGMFKFVMVNPKYRGKGYGKEMLRLAISHAFDGTGASAVSLNVFPENEKAKKCYESIGFTERRTDPDAFSYGDESWGRCNMVFYKK